MKEIDNRWVNTFYSLIEKKKTLLGYWKPENEIKILKDTIDIHIHSGSGRIDELSLAKQASEFGMKAIVIKSTYCMSVDVARVTSEATAEWCSKLENIRPTKVFGGIVLEPFVGGLNPKAVEYAILFGAKKIWMPTASSVGHLIRSGLKEDEAMNKGLSILKNEKIIPEVKDILDMIADANIALSLGHLDKKEMFILIEEAKSRGINKIVVDHPHLGLINLTVEEQKEMAENGVFINNAFVELTSLWSKLSPIEMAKDIKYIGAENCILSTDLGQIFAPSPVEGLRVFIRLMMLCGLTKKEIDLMTKDNPSKILGLN